jgi:hypothetical protein
MKPFPKTQRDVITLTIDEDGDLLFLKTDSADIFMELGTTVTKRASHVEPGSRYDRWFFHLLRFLFGDKGRVAEWTRTWNVLWRVNTSPIGGPLLRWKHVLPSCPQAMAEDIYYEAGRQKAIDTEIVFLNNYFAERGIK